MSHLASFKTQVTDRNALVRALERMGFKGKVEVHDKAQRLKGFHTEDNKVGNVIVRSKNTGIPADIGFELNEADGTYIANIDEYNYSGWSGSSGVCYNKAWQTKLYTYYNVEKSKIEFENRGLAYEETKDEIGRIKLEVKFITKNEPGKITVHL